MFTVSRTRVCILGMNMRNRGEIERIRNETCHLFRVMLDFIGNCADSISRTQRSKRPLILPQFTRKRIAIRNHRL